MVLTLMATMTTSLLEKESKTRRQAAPLESAGWCEEILRLLAKGNLRLVVILLVGVFRFWVFVKSVRRLSAECVGTTNDRTEYQFWGFTRCDRGIAAVVCCSHLKNVLCPRACVVHTGQRWQQEERGRKGK